MCGRYTNTAGIDELNDRFKVPIEREVGTHRFNIAPTEEVLAIVASKGEAEPPSAPSWAGRWTTSRSRRFSGSCGA